MGMRCIHALAFIVLAWSNAGLADDRQDIERIVDEYRRYEESGDMIAQGQLMTDDRVMMYVGGLFKGDNRELMRDQQASMDEFRERFPGVRYDMEIRNLEIRSWGSAALVTFESLPKRIVPDSLPAERLKELGAAKTPLLVAHVLVKQDGAWKIAFTSFVPPGDD